MRKKEKDDERGSGRRKRNEKGKNESMEEEKGG